MNIRTTSLIAVAAALVASAAALAQQPAAPAAAPAAPPVIASPSQNCTLTPAEIAAGRKVALAFFSATGDDRVALADPTYKQHNPVFKKRAEENKVTDFEEFRNSFGSAALAARGQGRQGGGAGGGAGRAAAPMPPGPNNQFEVVTTECDITTVIHRTWRQDPVTEGRWFEAFTFDSFRVKNGKLTEHWDTAVITAPAAAPAGGAPAAPAAGRGN